MDSAPDTRVRATATYNIVESTGTACSGAMVAGRWSPRVFARLPAIQADPLPRRLL